MGRSAQIKPEDVKPSVCPIRATSNHFSLLENGRILKGGLIKVIILIVGLPGSLKVFKCVEHEKESHPYGAVHVGSSYKYSGVC